MKWTAGLTAPQIAAVTGVFWFTLIGAILLALWFRWRNGRHDSKRQLSA